MLPAPQAALDAGPGGYPTMEFQDTRRIGRGRLTARIFAKLIVGVLCVLIVALAAVDVLVTRLAEDDAVAQRHRELSEKASMLAQLSDAGFASLPREEFISLARRAGVRITVIAPDGAVLADSDALPEEMENHGSRPEVRSALDGAEGASRRMSPTLGVQSFYVAIPVPVGALRVAVPLSDIEAQITAIRKETLVSMIYAFLPAMLVAAYFARSFSSKLAQIIGYAEQLADGGFRRRLNWGGRDEFSLLARKLDGTAEKLENTFDQLEQEHKELERQEQIRKDFVINVSHELRTPLASIQGYTETLLNGAVDDPEHNMRFLGIIRQNVQRLGNLTSDLLALSRIELKLQKLQPASYLVNRLIGDCVESLRPLIGRKRLAVEVTPAPDAAEVFCDAEALHQALSNLLDNAIKYSPEGGRIEIAATPLASGEAGQFDFIEISVRDSGQGIPEEDLPRLFERFYRVDKARSRELGGTGLGLAIVKHLSRAMGGKVRVESSLGEGALFAFTVPVHDLGLAEEAEVKSELTAS